MNKWKRVAALALAGVTALGMTACGGNTGGGSDAAADGGAGSSDGTGELTVAIWDTYQEPGLKTIMEGFTEQTGIQVKLQVTPWDQYWTMMEAGATGGTLPDVF